MSRISISAGLYQMLVNALKRDAEEGKQSRAEMLEELQKDASMVLSPVVPDDYMQALRLIASIFYYGNFVAETRAEMDLEAVMRKLGYFAESEDQLMQIIESTEAAMLKGEK